MRVLILAFLLGACTVPPPMPVKAEEKQVVEPAPKPPPPEKPKPVKPAAPKADPPTLPPCPELSAPVHPRQLILQKMDCVIRNNLPPK